MSIDLYILHILTPTEWVGIMSAYNNRSHVLSQEGTHGIHMMQLTYADNIIVQAFFSIKHFLIKTWSEVSDSDATCRRITSFLHFKRNIALTPHKFACALAFICQAKGIGAGQPKLPTFTACQTHIEWLVIQVNLNFPGEKAPND